MRRYMFPVLVAVLCWGGLSAQNNVLPSRSLTIEGAYNPSMSEQEKIMPVPEQQQVVRQEVAVSYRTESRPQLDYERGLMGVFGEQTDDVQPSRYYGLARLGYGLRNVSDGLLDAGWRISDRDLLKVSGIMDGWATKPDGEWKSRMFNGDLKVEYSHRFDSLEVGLYGALGHSRFNYREGKDMTPAMMDNSSLLNKTGRGETGVWLNGAFRNVEWNFDTGIQWYRRRGLNQNGTERDNSERLLRIVAGMEMPMAGGTGGVDYRQKTAMYDWQGLYGTDYSNFTAITLSPYWEKVWGSFETHLGLNLDIRTGAGNKALLSPVVTSKYSVNDKVKLLACVTGGLKDNSMRTLTGISPYWSEQLRIKDGYELLNASLGVSYYQGTWGNLSFRGGYRHILDDIFQVAQDSIIMSSLLWQETSDAVYASLDARMQFADRAQISMDMTFNSYIGKYSGGIMAFKPVMDASLFGKVMILKGLDAMVSYHAMVFCKMGGKRMPMVNDLAVTVDYDFMPNLSFYATVNRLAGGDWYYYAGYRAIKPSVMLGATYRF